ncbi:hypothetical protein LZ554_007904 [Drepanopeziza brunnea f. sp. 'monogermtubi']|nr:hypothetical protein LZ554_007904 [Drepanopeziza brunnea f. sp. 'monogermtubi']
MARDYLNPRFPQSFKKLSLSASPSTKKRAFHNNFFDHKPSSLLSKPLSNKLPLRSRPIMSSSAGLRRQQHDPAVAAPPPPPAAPVQVLTGLEECGILDSMSKKRTRSQSTPTDEARYAKRVKITTISATDDMVTSNRVITRYFGHGLIRKQKRALARMRRDSARMPASAQRGMTNPGVLCYRLSLLQSLLHLPGFVNWVMDFLGPEQCVSNHCSDCVSCSLHQLCVAYWSGASLAIPLKHFDNTLKSSGWSTDTEIGHGDPDEQMIKLCDYLRGELPTKYFSLLDHTISMRFNQVIGCPCGNKSVTPNRTTSNLALSMQPKSAAGLAGYVRNLMQDPSPIDDYQCGKCEKKVTARMYSEVTHFPKILSIQLKRIDFAGRKDNSAVNIPATLDLSQYAVDPRYSKGLYELVAVIKHQGTAQYGHYICAARGPDGQWMSYDDLKMSKTTLEAATKNCRGMTPYMMFYEKKRAPLAGEVHS